MSYLFVQSLYHVAGLVAVVIAKTGQNYKKYDVQSNIFTIISRNACFLKSLDGGWFQGQE